MIDKITKAVKKVATKVATKKAAAKKTPTKKSVTKKSSAKSKKVKVVAVEKTEKTTPSVVKSTNHALVNNFGFGVSVCRLGARRINI